MKRRIAVAAVLVLACPVLGWAQKPRVAVQKAVLVEVDKAVDFAKFRTYSYQAGQPANLKDVDTRIVTAIAAQLEGLGLTKSDSGPGDIIVTYGSVTRTDVDLTTFDKTDPAPGMQRKPAQTYPVGTLVVDVKPSASGRTAWRARVDGVLDGDVATQLKTIDDAVIALFGLYPTRTATKK
jgi:hypothetical protein